MAALLAVSAGLFGGPARAVAPPPDATASHPYFVVDGRLNFAERAARSRSLEGEAATRGDTASEARHAAMACLFETLHTNDPRMTSPSCADLRRLAATNGLLDVQLVVEAIPAELALKFFNFRGAEAMFASVMARAASLDPTSPEGRPLRRAWIGHAVALASLARYDEATAEFERARNASRRAGDIVVLAGVDTWDCSNQMTQGEMRRAHEMCDRARAELAQRPDLTVDLDLTYITSQLHMADGDRVGALAGFERAAILADRLGGALLGPVARTEVARALVELGNLEQARTHLATINREVAAGRFFAGLVPIVELEWGRLERASSHPAEALPHFVVASRSTPHYVTILGLRGLAWARRKLGDIRGAQSALEEAIRQMETERVGVSGAAARANIAQVHAGVYSDLVSVRWELEGPAAASAALDIAESGRARALLDALSSAQMAGTSAPTLRAQAVQATLRPDDVLVEYVSSEDRLMAITVTRDRIAITALPGAGTAESLGRRVDFFGALAQERDETALGPAAARLYADLLAPALEGISASAHTLVIAADGPLLRLPFDALGDSTRVIDRWDVVTVPSASALASRVRRVAPSAAALVVAAPAGDGGPLPAAPAEAAAIRRRIGGAITELSGAAATRERLASLGLGRFTLLHFASHALVDDALPMRSGLVLAPNAPGAEGLWSADEIYRTTLGADLVVLSACGTAAGPQTAGEGVMSLARAFLYAGAGATIATLWDVPDAPGPVFADVLYGELAAGRSLGAATADARRELRRRGAPPRAWAAYVLTGNPGAHVGVTARVDPWTAASHVAIVLAVVLLLGGAAMRLAAAPWSARWRAPVLSGIGCALLAAFVMARAAPFSRWNENSLADRGSAHASFTPVVSDGRVTWRPVAGADEHLAELFDAAGRPVGQPIAATPPFAVPNGVAGGWVRIEARQRGQRLARSALVRLP